MDDWGGWLITGLGVATILATLRDIFHTLWHPSGRGDLTHLVVRGVWRMGQRRRTRGHAGVLTGPLALALVIVTWLALIVLGGALVYGPHLPEGFVFSSSLDGGRRGGALDAVYLSLVTVATLGFGDVVPAAPWLRIAVPLQALIGFALLTASVTWVLQVYPALIRRRALAVRLAQLRTVSFDELLGDVESTLAVPLLESLAGALIQARVDLRQYTETYYFRDGDEDSALPAMLGVAVRLSEAGRTAPRTDVRLAAALLSRAIDDFAHVLDEEFLRVGGSTADVLAAYASAHHYGGQD